MRQNHPMLTIKTGIWRTRDGRLAEISYVPEDVKKYPIRGVLDSPCGGGSWSEKWYAGGRADGPNGPDDGADLVEYIGEQHPANL